ncbi:MAG: hypothetical protein U0359_14750 [Byssovorax sp.]
MNTPAPVPQARPLLVLLLASLGLTGCGAGAYAEPPLPPTADGSLAAFDRAENELMAALGPQASPATPSATAAPGAGPPGLVQGYGQAAPPPPPPSGDAPAPTQQPAGATGWSATKETEQARAGASDPCSMACRALASMHRAADHLCGLAGETDGRCENARQRVASATDRVRFFCPACSAAN